MHLYMANQCTSHTFACRSLSDSDLGESFKAASVCQGPSPQQGGLGVPGALRGSIPPGADYRLLHTFFDGSTFG